MLYTPDQPTTNNIFETLVFEASAHNNNLTRRVEDFYTVTQSIDESDHTFTRLEKTGDVLSIEIDNWMVSGPTGGVRVEIRLINKGPASTIAKLFYYCDLEISDTLSDDEAGTINDPGGGGVLALEQYDAPPADPAKPLWFGGCPIYKSWEIDVYSNLVDALDAGISQLSNTDNTAPGGADHTMALSGEATVLLPGGTAELFAGIGGPGIYGCPQFPACPWDCARPADKMVSVVDFLALLAQWGTPGTCDFNNSGVVDIVDFLKLLAAWGPCPAPFNDECITQEVIDKTDPEGTTAVHFDMYGATPSPEPYKCLPEPPADDRYKDTWYCLTNVTGQKIGVTITTTMDLFIEVNDGCGCPPGPVIACGEGLVGTDQFKLLDGQQALIRLIDWHDLPNDELKGSMFIANKIIPDGVNFFEDPGLFAEEIAAQGKFSKGSWAFKPDYFPAAAPPWPVSDMLDINTHLVNAPGVWWDGIQDLWPPEIDNVQFSSNVNPQGPLQPYGVAGMRYLKPGSVPDIDNNALTEGVEDVIASFDIISGPPAGDNHTAMALELVSWDDNNIDDPVDWLITVYDKNEKPIGEWRASMVQPVGKPFLGIVTKDPSITIGRVDIWDEWCSHEGISFIELFYQGPPPLVNFFTDEDLFWEAINEAGKVEKFEWDFKPHNDIPYIPMLADYLDMFSHGANFPDDPWTSDTGDDLWPPYVDNVQFVSNSNPQATLDPAGGMVFLHPGNYTGITNNALVEAFGSNTSLSILSGPPQGGNHTAFALQLVSVEGQLPTLIHVTVFDKNDMVMGKFLVDYPGDKAFVGILTKGPDITIGRIDIWDEAGGSEGISYIQPFWQIVPGAPQLRALNGP
ncbi:MAG: hypothetical protein ACYS1B_07240 [Planctomycetota bacterium]